jgi:hypothetical protein
MNLTEFREKYKDRTMGERGVSFRELMLPITWDCSSSIGSRKALVYSRYDKVKMAYPFFSDLEKRIADEWIENEHHYGLWD